MLPGVRPTDPHHALRPDVRTGNLLGRPTGTLCVGQCRDYHAIRTGVRKLCHAVLGIGARSLPQWPSAGAGPVLGGVGGLRVPGSGGRELRAPHVLLSLVRADSANPALLRCATAGGPVVHSSQACLMAIRGRVSRGSVTLRRLGVVLSSIPPDFVRRTPPVARHHPPMPGRTHAEPGDSSSGAVICTQSVVNGS